MRVVNRESEFQTVNRIRIKMRVVNRESEIQTVNRIRIKMRVVNRESEFQTVNRKFTMHEHTAVNNMEDYFIN